MVQAVALMCVFGLGMSFALLGSISVKLMPRVKIDESKFGTLISTFMFTCLVASLVIGVVTDAVGYKWVAVIGFAATAGCILWLARSRNYVSVMLGCVLLGIGAMALNTAGNVMAPQVIFSGKDPAIASNLANVFFGLGLFLTPLIVSFLFRKTSYEVTISILGFIVLLPAVIAFMAGGYPQSSARLDIAAAVGLLKEPAVIVAAFVLFCYIALEASFCNWLPSFGKEVSKKQNPSIDDDAADASGQMLLSIFAISMMAGRLITSLVPARIGLDLASVGGWLIAGSALTGAVVIFIMLDCRKSGYAKVLAAAAGLVFGPCFPTTVGVTFSKFQPEIYGSVFGIIFAVGLAGAVIIPKMMGNIAKGASVQKSLKMLLFACAALLVLAIILELI